MRIYKEPPARDLYLSEWLYEIVVENVILLDASQSVSKSTNPVFIRVTWNAKILPKRRSWHRLPVFQHFLLNSVALLERLAQPVT